MKSWNASLLTAASLSMYAAVLVAVVRCMVPCASASFRHPSRLSIHVHQEECYLYYTDYNEHRNVQHCGFKVACSGKRPLKVDTCCRHSADEFTGNSEHVTCVTWFIEVRAAEILRARYGYPIHIDVVQLRHRQQSLTFPTCRRTTATATQLSPSPVPIGSRLLQ